MTMQTESYELQTVRQVAQRLCMSETGVRKLGKRGTLSALKASGRLPFSEEALAAYAARCGHPLAVIAAMNYAQVAGLEQELFDLNTDYDMEHAPIHTPQGKAGRRSPAPNEQPPLFPGLS